MSEPLIIFKIAGRSCALMASDVQTVIELSAITPVPRAPEYIVGLAALRSQTLTVIDTRLVVGQAPSNFPTDHRAAVVQVSGHSYAFRVDQVCDVGTMLSDADTIPGGFGTNWQAFAKGMVETEMGPALLLNAANFIASCDQSVAAA